jgi:hypothetical protein
MYRSHFAVRPHENYTLGGGQTESRLHSASPKSAAARYVIMIAKYKSREKNAAAMAAQIALHFKA